jgi:cytochrome c oxidase cbb3-type subunit III
MSSRCVEIVAACVAALLASCEREQRIFSDPAATAPPGVLTVADRYADSAYAISEGKRLFEWFNCSGCHAQGGGSIGPALMDEVWIYGADPPDVFETIRQGRPNGMPAFRAIPDQQMWQLVAYVRSMGGTVRDDAAPGRSDSMNVKPSEQTMAR